ncbi:MAG: hypothetical protein K9G49_15685 [Taibaiella sp.]|nr:hypothetical protein [Taibaiella sp.]
MEVSVATGKQKSKRKERKDEFRREYLSRSGKDGKYAQNGPARKASAQEPVASAKDAKLGSAEENNSYNDKPKSGRKKQEIYYPDTKMRKRYQITVIAPLYLDELVRGESVTFRDKVPEKAAPGLAFYQGVKLAADSLRRAGANLEIVIRDAGSFSESPDMLILNRKMDSTDLIIGAVEQHDIPVLATYARKKRINFISALTNYDGWVKDNQYFTMLQPTLKSHCEFIIDDLSEKYAGQNVLLLYRTTSLADDNAALYMLNDLYSEVTFRKLQCNSMPDKELLATALDTTKPNIVVVSIQDPAYADSILSTLSESYPNLHFEIYGMPGWKVMPSLRKPNSYSNLTINITYPFNFEQKGNETISVVTDLFAREFGGVPGEMVWRGYETMMWYGTLQKDYGTIFNNDYTDLSGAPFTKFRIKPRWDRNGSLLYLENKHIYLSTYQGGVHVTK